MHDLIRKLLCCAAAMAITGMYGAGDLCARETAGAGTGYFAVGSALMSIGDLNSRLKNAGYNELSDNFSLIGGGGFGVSPTGLILGGEGYALVGKSAASGAFNEQLSGGVGFFDVGYLLDTGKDVSIYPILGIGGGGMNLRISDTGVRSFDGILANPRRESNVSNGGFMLNFSIGSHFLVGADKDSARRSGLMLGIRLGYLYSPWAGDWTFAGSTVSNGPSNILSGPYLYFTIGGGSYRFR